VDLRLPLQQGVVPLPARCTEHVEAGRSESRRTTRRGPGTNRLAGATAKPRRLKLHWAAYPGGVVGTAFVQLSDGEYEVSLHRRQLARTTSSSTRTSTSSAPTSFVNRTLCRRRISTAGGERSGSCQANWRAVASSPAGTYERFGLSHTSIAGVGGRRSHRRLARYLRVGGTSTRTWKMGRSSSWAFMNKADIAEPKKPLSAGATPESRSPRRGDTFEKVVHYPRG